MATGGWSSEHVLQQNIFHQDGPLRRPRSCVVAVRGLRRHCGHTQPGCDSCNGIIKCYILLSYLVFYNSMRSSSLAEISTKPWRILTKLCSASASPTPRAPPSRRRASTALTPSAHSAWCSSNCGTCQPYNRITVGRLAGGVAVYKMVYTSRMVFTRCERVARNIVPVLPGRALASLYVRLLLATRRAY